MFKHTLPIMLLGLALSWPAEAARSYGPIKEQDTLWNIATQLRPDNKATVQQTMLAIFYKNPQAFASNNINSLMKGAVIKAPSSAEARRYQRIDALREARKHNNYWKRGSNLPKITPPPVPKIKESKVSKRSKQAVAKTTVSYAATPKNTNRRLAKLQAQLQAAETKNQQLSAELTALQAKQNPNKPNPKLDAQVKKLKIELQELTTVLDQKDNHIKTLQSSLKNASETIKAQHADNMRLYDKLKEVSPNSVPAPPSSEGKSELKLSTVEAATAAVAGAAAGKAAAEAANSETKEATAQSVWADEKNAAEANKAAKPADKPLEGSESKNSATPSDATNTNKPTTEPQTLAAAVPSANATQAKTSITLPEKASSDTAEAATANKPTDKAATEKAGTDPAKTADKAEAKPATDQSADAASNSTSQTVDTKAAATVKPTDKTEVKTAETAAKAEDGKDGAASKSPATTSTETDSDIKAPSPASGASITPANDVKTASSVPVSQMLAQSGNQGGASGEKASPASSTPLRGVSPLAMAVALISLLFILALVWRAVLQQRDMRRLEDEEARVAERMRKRLEDNQATVPTSATLVDKKDPDPETEIKF